MGYWHEIFTEDKSWVRFYQVNCLPVFFKCSILNRVGKVKVSCLHSELVTSDLYLIFYLKPINKSFETWTLDCLSTSVWLTEWQAVVVQQRWECGADMYEYSISVQDKCSTSEPCWLWGRWIKHNRMRGDDTSDSILHFEGGLWNERIGMWNELKGLHLCQQVTKTHGKMSDVFAGGFYMFFWQSCPWRTGMHMNVCWRET